MRLLTGRRAESFVRKLEQRSATGLAKVEKQVRKIVDDVRMGPRVGIYSNGARVFVLPTPNVENFPRWLR